MNTPTIVFGRLLSRLRALSSQKDTPLWEQPIQAGIVSEETKQCITFVSAYWAYWVLHPGLPMPFPALCSVEGQILFESMADTLNSIPSPTSQQIQSFRESLEQSISAQMQSQLEGNESLTRAVVESFSLRNSFFEVNDMLQQAAEAAGLPKELLQYHVEATTRIERGEVHIRAGVIPSFRAVYPHEKMEVNAIVHAVEQHCCAA